MTATVIIVTLNRPDCVERCLSCLHAQTRLAEQIIVVDASADDLTRVVSTRFHDVVYLRNANGFGRMTASRNIGLRKANGNVIAFLDDDAFAHPTWLEHLLESYADPAVGAVGGRALNNQREESTIGAREIGQLKANGTLTGYFAADPGRTIEVEHVMGCNMSFRREVIAKLGGFREDYPGISGVREDTDMCLRVRSLGRRILFNPQACVDHLGAPQAKGRRFDARYMFSGMQNHCVMLQRNFGWSSPLLWRFFGAAVAEGISDAFRRIAGGSVRFGAVLAGLACGLAKATVSSLRGARGPIRTDPEAASLAAWLSRPASPGVAAGMPQADRGDRPVPR